MYWPRKLTRDINIRVPPYAIIHAPSPLQPQSLKKPHQTFRQASLWLARNLFSQPRLVPRLGEQVFSTMSSSTSSGPSLSKGGRRKKKPWAPPTSGSSSVLTGAEALAAYAAHRESTPLPEVSTSTARPRTPIFTRPAPPSLKRARSSTSSSLPTIAVEVLAGAHPNTSYFQHLFVKVALETGLGEF